MKFVMEDLRREEVKKNLPIIQMEIDYELLTLYDALQANDHVEIIKAKERLKQLRKQWLQANEK